MKAEADDGQGERERAESRDEQTPIDLRVFKRQVRRHDGADLIVLDGRDVERRDAVHAWPVYEWPQAATNVSTSIAAMSHPAADHGQTGALM